MRYICCGDPAGSIGTAGGTAEVPPQLLLEVLLQGALVAFHEQPPRHVGVQGVFAPLRHNFLPTASNNNATVRSGGVCKFNSEPTTKKGGEERE